MSTKPTSSSKAAYTEGVLSIVINIALFVIKYAAGTASGSVALIADSWHTLSDSISSLVVIIGEKISSKPADKKHPYGHGRFELVAALIIAALLALVGYEFMVESISRLSGESSAIFGTFAIVVTIISIVLKEGLAQYAIRMGKKYNNQVLKADGWHHRTDAISSGIILIGIILGSYFWWIDGVLGIIVALTIFYTSWEIASTAIDGIIGRQDDDDINKKIEQVVIQTVGNNLNIHHIHLHNYIRHKEVTFHIRMPKETILNDVHALCTKVEVAIKEELEICATIHVDPIELEKHS